VTYSPGAIVAVTGNYLSTPDPLFEIIGSDSRVTNSLAGDQVTFNGIPGPIIYAAPGQINTVVPFSLLSASLVASLGDGDGAHRLG
jgi:uncharacterized protein (TIGR03437 family)